MDYFELKQQFIAAVKKHLSPYFFTNDFNELRVRCPYCGDSIKSNRSAHLYIEMNNKSVFRFYCQRCNMSGFVSDTFLKDVKIIDYELMANFVKFNKGKSSQAKTKASSGLSSTNNIILNKININNKKLILPDFNNKASSIKKYQYLIERYNKKIPIDKYINTYRCVFSLVDFLRINDLEPRGNDVEFLKMINKQFVGFLSADQSHIIFRNIDKESKTRYHNYNIFGDPDAKKVYIPKCSIDLMKPANIIITEGIFDIIGVIEHFYNGKLDENNTLFVSSNGKGYNFIFNEIARAGIIDCNIKIYSDADVNFKFYKNLKSQSEFLKANPCKIIYNSISKDYGCPKDMIKLTGNFI